MNEVIRELYEIEAQAGKIMEQANTRRQELLENNRRQMEDTAKELEGEMEGRLTILRTQLEEQAAKEIHQLVENNRVQVEQLNETYQKDLNSMAQEIVKKITEV